MIEAYGLVAPGLHCGTVFHLGSCAKGHSMAVASGVLHGIKGGRVLVAVGYGFYWLRGLEVL